MKISVRFMTLEGKFALLREETFDDLPAAKLAIEAHAKTGDYTNVKLADNDDDDTMRFTARTPGGRSGRNIAYAEQTCDPEAG